MSWAVTIGARPSDGSSRSRTLGLATSARPIASIWRSPPESVAACLATPLASGGEQVVDLVDRGAALAAPASPQRAEPEVLLDGQLLDDRPALGDVGDAVAGDVLSTDVPGRGAGRRSGPSPGGRTRP